MKFKKIKAYAAALLMTASVVPVNIISMPVSAKYGTGNSIVEHLDRGIYAIKSGSGLFVSWRWNADDDDNAEFRLYRDNALIYTSTAGKATSYQDNGGNVNSRYRVDYLVNGAVVSSEDCRFTSGSNYFDIPLNSPGSQYSPNDCCVGDVDGDGQYEIFLKWDPNNSQDNSKSGYTDNVYIDCVTLEGKTLWRVDLGKNIRAGQHYTQMCVADFDCDGKAELITKTADGTKDGQGKIIGDGSKDYRNASGYVLSGAEYMTLFDGQTGASLDTIDFPVPRGDVSSWGDNYGNRVDRFNSGIAYLDGVHPTAIYNRGYYTRMTISAVDVVDKKLSVRWIFDSNNKGSEAAVGQGNHNLMVGDVDGDGKQEISMGDCVIDDNGKLLWSSGKGHGDAQHLGDFIPERPGLELWQCHEHAPYGVSLFDAKTGETIFHFDADKDTGRCCADNVWAGNNGAEFWGARPAKAVLDQNGKTIANLSPSMNFLIYWDGDLEREMLSGTMISKMVSKDNIDYFFNADGCESNNSTKAVPCMTADLFGDWREELIMRTSDNKHLRIWCSNYTTDYRLTTLMHDVQYRAQSCCQQSAYNQPPHASFFLGTGYALPERPAVTVLGGTEFSIPDGNLITSINVKDRSNRYSWSLQSGLKVGDNVFGDRICKFTAIPDSLQGAEWVRTACDSKKYADDEVSFTAAKDITVYVGIDTRAEANASWLSDWTKTVMTMTDDGNPNVTYNIYSKDIKGGQQITLGAVNMNTAVNYVIAATEYNSAVTTTSTTTTTATITTTSVQQPSDYGFIYGDLNNDGRVDVFDMVLMRQELVDGHLDRNTKRRADVDADGKTGVADAVQLQSFLLKGSSFSAVEEKRMFAYAVDQTINEGVAESTNSGYRDEAYVNLDNKVGSNIEWTIYAPIDGNYLCTFGTANGSADNRQMKIEVNSQTDFWVQDFLSTGAWTEWQERGIVLPLKKGENKIKMTSFTDQGGPNLDYMHIEWTDEPIAQVYEETPAVTMPVQSNVSRTIYIAGDSTVQTYKASYAPQQGWGAYLGENMPDGVTVSNHAIAGRSSKSFYDNGRLDTILNSIQSGDYLLIQFGINDSAASKAERYAPTCGKVPGTSGSFEDYMAKYIEGAKSRGATPILVTTVIGLKSYDSSSKKFVGSYSNYCNAMKQLAAYYNIPCIDLNSLMVAHYNSIGYDAAYKYHMCSTGSTDMTHFAETGAKAVAKLVADEMKRQGLC